MRTRSKVKLVLSVLFCMVLLLGCKETEKKTTKETITIITDGDDVDPTDLDGDGLSNDEETNVYHTSPIFEDTDGDGFSDYEEVVEYGFSPWINPYYFNPLIADLPKISIILMSPPEPYMDMTTVEGTTKTFEAITTQEGATILMSNTITTDSTTKQVGAALEIGYAQGFHALLTVSASMTWETSVTNTQETTREQRHSLSQAEGFERSNEIIESGGGIMATVEVKNNGNYSYRIEQLILSAVIPDFHNPEVFHPLGNLILDTDQYVQFPKITLGPGQSINPLPFINDHLDLATAKKMFREIHTLIIKPTFVELTDQEGKPLAFNLTAINAKDAMITIDYAGYRPLEKYLVATNSDPDHPGLTAGEAMHIIHVPFEEGQIVWGDTLGAGLFGLRDDNTVSCDYGRKAYWIVAHYRFNGLEPEWTFYNGLEPGGYVFEDIKIKAGDALFLIYTEDKDGDGIYYNEEILRGTLDTSTDSDNDEVPDNIETTLGLDPAFEDTDGDLLLDSIDPHPLEWDYYNVSAGSDFSLLVKTDGTVWSWGHNNVGQLGLGYNDPDREETPQVLYGVAGVVQASAGYDHAVALQSDATLWAWGGNGNGQLGFGATGGMNYYPEWVYPDDDWCLVSAGQYQTHALKCNAQHWAWGKNSEGQLGVGDTTQMESPVLIMSGERWMDVSAGSNFHVALNADGSIWSSGDNTHGQLGLVYGGTYDYLPHLSGDTVAFNFRAFASRFTDQPDPDEEGYQGFSIRSDGTLMAWGENFYGQLGNYPTGTDYAIPFAVGTGWWQVAAGSDHTLGIKSTGELWVWGRNQYGQLGLGHLSPESSDQIESRPRKIRVAGPWTQVSAGDKHSLAIRADGTVWAWGRNDYGQVGEGSTVDQVLPVCITSVIPGNSCAPNRDTWTWMSGDTVTDQGGIYGTRGVPDPANKPGARWGSVSWTDQQGNLWLFGGDGYDASGGSGRLNDLWRWDGTNWTWMSGDDVTRQCGIYGIKGVPHPDNKPGGREGAVSWADSQGNLWLFGGKGYDATYDPIDPGLLNDLWKYDIEADAWTWMSGDTVTYQYPIYGTKGVPDPANKPGARSDAVSWLGPQGNLWLFGGHGAGIGIGLLNDLWKYDIEVNAWTWMSGDKYTYQYGIYFFWQGIPSSYNKPGARKGAVSWTDPQGNLWLFGGNGLAQYTTGYLNDLWVYTIGSNTWTWITGYCEADFANIYGTKGVSHPDNTPGGRFGSIYWTDPQGNLWLFGGEASGSYFNNDLWKFDGRYWAWMSGDNVPDQVGIYGTKGVPDPLNKPGARQGAVSWVGPEGNLWLFGGANPTTFNDLWVYRP